MVPNPLEIVFQAYCPPIYLNLNNLLLGDALGENKPVPNCRIIAFQKRRNHGFGLKLKAATGETIMVDTSGHLFSYAEQSKTVGGLLFLMKDHSQTLEKHILRLLTLANAKKQVQGRGGNPTAEYYLIHHSQKQRRGKREVVGVVQRVCKNRWIFVLANETYGTSAVDYCYLDSI